MMTTVRLGTFSVALNSVSLAAGQSRNATATINLPSGSSAGHASDRSDADGNEWEWDCDGSDGRHMPATAASGDRIAEMRVMLLMQVG